MPIEITISARQLGSFFFPDPIKAGNVDAFANPLPHREPHQPSPQFDNFDDLVFLYKNAAYVDDRCRHDMTLNITSIILSFCNFGESSLTNSMVSVNLFANIVAKDFLGQLCKGV